MSTTVLDALYNAQINFETIGKMGAGNNPIFMIAMEQMNNAIAALESGVGPDSVIQEHMLGEVITGIED
jgi:hypothetical protein